MAGRPRFKPTKAQRSDVETMKADGWSNERIALLLRISRPTLEANFASELQYGRDVVKLENLRSLRQMAKKNASANRQLHDRIDMAATTRPNQPAAPEPEERQAKQPKLGKKEEAAQAAQHPDTTTDMGSLMARRMVVAGKLN